MICKPCGYGAAIVSVAQREERYVNGVRNAVLHIHKSECRGGTWCDCQHRVPKADSSE